MYNMRMIIPRGVFPLVVASLIGAGCASAALQSNEIRFSLNEAPILVKESGAIIVNKRQVGRLLADGKVVDSHNRPLAWLRDKDIRLRGGVTLEFREDAEGTVYLSETAQQKAQLKPVVYRIRTDGTMASTKNARGLPVRGAHTAKNRRIVLLLLLLSENSLWPS